MNVDHLEPRLLPQLERFARSRPERMAQLLGRLRESSPEIFEELVLTALEHGDLTPQEGSLMVGVSEEVLMEKQERFRHAMAEGEEASLISKDSHNVARVHGTIVAVWEIVRAFRRTGVVADLQKLFPSLTETEIRAALAYAGRHPDEVSLQIQRFEDFDLQIKTRAVITICEAGEALSFHHK